jgi:hypothetical protein
LTVVIVHGRPLEAGSLPERTLLWVRDALERRGLRARHVSPDDPDALDAALETAGLVVLADLRGVHLELAWIARLASLRVPFVWLVHGWPGCVVAHRDCGRCRLVRVCGDYDRTEIYRQLAARAHRVVFQTPLHRTLSTSLMDVESERVAICLPPAPLQLLDAPSPDAPDLGMVRRGDSDAVAHLDTYAHRHPARAMAIFAGGPRPAALPSNVQWHPRVRGHAAELALQRAGRLIDLPGRPVALGEEVLAMALAGRPFVAGELVGAASLPADPEALLDRLAGDRAALVELLVRAAGAAGGALAAPVGPVRRALVWSHHIGLGDAINLLPVVDTLGRSLGPANVRWGLPAKWHALLAPASTVPVVDERSVAPETAGRDGEAVFETTIRSEEAWPGEIVEQRWVNLELAAQEGATATTHENLLSFLGRAGFVGAPRRPEIRVAPEPRREALSRLEGRPELRIAVHPGAGNTRKRWPVSRFAELVERLRVELGACVVLVTGPGEESLALAMGPVDLDDRASPLPALAALFACCTALVANDSGLMHLACAVDLPPVAFYGPSGEHAWRPWHPLGRAVAARNDAGARVADLARLGVDRVFQAVCEHLRLVGTCPPAAWQAARSSYVTHPEARRSAQGWTLERTRARLEVQGPSDPFTAVLTRAAQPASWADLAAVAGEDLPAFLLAMELLLPAWGTQAGALDLVFPARPSPLDALSP